MSKFANRPVAAPAPARQSLGATSAVRTRTGNGARAVGLEDKTALFTLAVTNMVSEGNFYEGAGSRDNRFVDLIHRVTKSDPEWVARFVPYLRNSMQMRSASVVMAAEYVKAGGPNGRKVVASALMRADEPAEMLAYWASRYGKRIPQPVKRGVADASQRLFNEYGVSKYDGTGRTWRIADVIQVAHVKPSAAWQSELFRYALDRRYQGAEAVPGEGLTMLRKQRELDRILGDNKARFAFLNSGNVGEALKEAGYTWERLAGTGTMDAKAWEAVIPAMGYMALLRNLRNFDEAGIATSVKRTVRDTLTNPEAVARSRQLPFRFLSAYKNVRGDFWTSALAEALDLSVQNIPEVKGNTLTLIDVSGSMHTGLSTNSSVQLWEVGALFGAAMAARNGGTVVAFGSSHAKVDIRKGDSILRSIEKVRNTNVGHSTNLVPALREFSAGHDRTVVMSDMQINPAQISRYDYGGYGWRNSSRRSGAELDSMALTRLFYTFDLAGYGKSPVSSGEGKYMLAGFSDKVFAMMDLLERGKDADWPF